MGENCLGRVKFENKNIFLIGKKYRCRYSLLESVDIINRRLCRRLPVDRLRAINMSTRFDGSAPPDPACASYHRIP